MKGRFLILLLCPLSIMLMGCGSLHNQSDLKETSYSVDKKGEDDMDHIEMTDTEKRLLGAIYPDADRIEQGKLFSHQEEALRQLRAGMEYLAEKYPAYTFEVLTFAPADKFTQWASFLVQDTEGQNYEVRVEPSDASYICSDNFYWVLIREDYDKMVSDILEGEGFNVLSYTKFTEYLGMAHSADITAEKILSENPKLTRLTHLYVEASGNNDVTAAKIQEGLKKQGIYGAYFLYFVPSWQADDVLTLESDPERTSWDHISFNCFDIDQ